MRSVLGVHWKDWFEAETPIIWPPDRKSWLIWKDPDAGKDWGQEEKEMTEDEMVGWHHWLNGQGIGWTMGVGDGQRGLVSCSPWGHKESDRTELLTELKIMVVYFNFLRNLCTVFRSGCINLHFYQQWVKVPFSPFSQLWGDNVVVLIGISLIITD